MFNLGEKLRDKVTGFEGIAISKIEYLNGCVQFCLKPKIKKSEANKLPEGQWFDIDELEFINNGIFKKKKVTNIGGDYSSAPKL